MDSPIYDLILAGGHVIDPASGIDGIADVAIEKGRIAAVSGAPIAAASRKRIDARGKLVLPGLIDTHGHIFTYVTGRFGLPADLAGVHSGVTTIVDQGGASCMTFPAFRHFIAQPAATRVLSFISAYVVGGLEGHYYPELYGPHGVDVDATVKSIEANRDLVRGIKAHAEIGGMRRWGVRVMEQASEIAAAANLPLYIHFGQLWPEPGDDRRMLDIGDIVPSVIPLLKAGDVIAHPFSRHPGGFMDERGQLHPLIREALDRGLKVDVGHGSHFSFRVARQALEAGIIPDTLGADMHGYNTRALPPPGTPATHPDDHEAHPFAGAARFSLSYAMSEMLALGVPLDTVVRMVTINAARMLGLEEIGTLRTGAPADVTILDDLRGRFRFEDNEGSVVVGDRMLQPVFCVRAGKTFQADADILPHPVPVDGAVPAGRP
ncbi:amidohydrolase/deacetylase family metallohydrolase [Sphingomonas sp.]|uniref:amidohydrolase/deacetylase family metallohydrolase n=1 Tax=Sphingomonas sp. TaxID=28214 RepID=UPI000DB18123|nr:amidohydrolase/deacetylase family metallohydrolase [Sphingomonas sp.]PZU08061.1 MAG: amidohydrolase/deacetylase family metallohydrolase [Sphingomonas sp.]